MSHGHGGHGGGDMPMGTSTSSPQGSDAMGGAYTVGDTAHILFALPIFVYGYMLCLDAYSAIGNNAQKLPKWLEPMILLLLGLVVVFVSAGKLQSCMGVDCKNEGAVAFLFGVLMMVFAIVAFLNLYLSLFKHSVSWTMPVIFVISGVILAKQSPNHPNTAFTDSIATAFTTCAIASAALRALMFVDPVRWGAFTAYAMSVTALTFLAQSQAITAYMMSKYYMAHTVLLGICVICALLLILFLFYVNRKSNNNGFRPKHQTKVTNTKGS